MVREERVALGDHLRHAIGLRAGGRVPLGLLLDEPLSAHPQSGRFRVGRIGGQGLIEELERAGGIGAGQSGLGAANEALGRGARRPNAHGAVLVFEFAPQAGQGRAACRRATGSDRVDVLLERLVQDLFDLRLDVGHELTDRPRGGA